MGGGHALEEALLEVLPSCSCEWALSKQVSWGKGHGSRRGSMDCAQILPSLRKRNTPLWNITRIVPHAPWRVQGGLCWGAQEGST